MKKIIIMFMLLMVLSLASCSTNNAVSSKSSSIDSDDTRTEEVALVFNESIQPSSVLINIEEKNSNCVTMQIKFDLLTEINNVELFSDNSSITVTTNMTKKRKLQEDLCVDVKNNENGVCDFEFEGNNILQTHFVVIAVNHYVLKNKSILTF